MGKGFVKMIGRTNSIPSLSAREAQFLRKSGHEPKERHGLRILEGASASTYVVRAVGIPRLGDATMLDNCKKNIRGEKGSQSKGGAINPTSGSVVVAVPLFLRELLATFQSDFLGSPFSSFLPAAKPTGHRTVRVVVVVVVFFGGLL